MSVTPREMEEAVPGITTGGAAGFFDNPFDSLFTSLADEAKARALTTQQIEDDIVELIQANKQIDGPSLSNFDQYLTAVWRMNDLGPPVNDSLNSNDLTVLGSPLFVETTAINGNSVKLVSKNNDYFTRSPGFGPGQLDDYSVNIWFRPISSPSFNIGIMGWHVDSANSFIMEFSSGTQILLQAEFLNSFPINTTRTLPNSIDVTDDSFHMFTVTHDAANKTYNFYMDGVFFFSDTYTTHFNPSVCDFFLGNRKNGSSQFNGFQGWIDETRLWKSTGSGALLLPNAINELWNAGIGIFP